MGKLLLESGTYYEVLLIALSSAIKEKERQIQEAYTDDVRILDRCGEILSQHEECDIFLKTANECTPLIADFRRIHLYLSDKHLDSVKRNK
ncbi:hypothetical protein F9U39_19915 [Pectobacterium versatile]|uniref:Uncharacterized protein n=2 Tax=Pectobacterium TaxID=122277 RepID=A0AAW3SYY0_9GAMM|nr:MULTISPECIES: hypothetical protein [Pectobacterium]MBA5206058.1 hypothetical protein [Pectobacterium aroidearum]MBN3180062.1 hypothetical protein [Pectobacterium parmentieri]MBQ4791693.1 hypothetical protein [Pectobacterium versatile]QHQ23464.1 hypothetical protein GMX10_04770 [Pectobacterium parvum]QRN28992.1 hypothetical protein IG623_16900 [Pectobacterium parmentieri]